MKKIFFFIVLIFPSLIFSQGQSKATIDWIPMTSAEKWSAKYDREVLIFFYRKGCDYCERMKKEVLSDPLVIKTINENFLPVMLDGKSKKPIIFNGKEYVNDHPFEEDAPWRHNLFFELVSPTNGNFYWDAGPIPNAVQAVITETAESLLTPRFIKIGKTEAINNSPSPAAEGIQIKSN